MRAGTGEDFTFDRVDRDESSDLRSRLLKMQTSSSNEKGRRSMQPSKRTTLEHDSAELDELLDECWNPNNTVGSIRGSLVRKLTQGSSIKVSDSFGADISSPFGFDSNQKRKTSP